jgi:hypothetical protein
MRHTGVYESAEVADCMSSTRRGKSLFSWFNSNHSQILQGWGTTMKLDKEAILKIMIDEIEGQAYEPSEMYVGYFDKEICKEVILHWLKIAKEERIKLV